MKTFFSSQQHSTLSKRAVSATVATLVATVPSLALAASSWAPTLLVNTESFQTIDEGDSTTNVELRFGSTLNEKIIWNRTKGSFQFTDGVSVLGTLSGSSLNVDRNATIGGTLTATGAARFKSTVNADGNITTLGRLSGASLRVSGAGEVQGALSASGSVRTDGDLTINDDQTAADGVLTFGNASGNQTLKFLNTAQKFQFSRGISVLGTISGSSLNVDRNATVGGTLTATGSIRTKGNLSGSTLTVDGAINWRGQTYNGPTTQTANGFLKTDGAGNLTWSTASIGNGSGNIISLHPEYDGAVYFSSGSSFVGQLTASGGTTALDNSYVWTSTRGTLQDYWISIRVRVPDNFSSWDPTKPIEFRYKTGVASAANNHVTIRMKDTAGANVALTSASGLASTTWTTASIKGPEAAGTWTPKGFFTVFVKVAADSTAGANAAAGFINLNYETTTP